MWYGHGGGGGCSQPQDDKAFMARRWNPVSPHCRWRLDSLASTNREERSRASFMGCARHRPTARDRIDPFSTEGNQMDMRKIDSWLTASFLAGSSLFAIAVSPCWSQVTPNTCNLKAVWDEGAGEWTQPICVGHGCPDTDPPACRDEYEILDPNTNVYWCECPPAGEPDCCHTIQKYYVTSQGGYWGDPYGWGHCYSGDCPGACHEIQSGNEWLCE